MKDLNDEIQNRLCDSDWDNKIASRVLHIKENRRIKMIRAVVSISLVLLVSIGGLIINIGDENELEISSQEDLFPIYDTWTGNFEISF
jgi:hypothetical protein